MLLIFQRDFSSFIWVTRDPNPFKSLQITSNVIVDAFGDSICEEYWKDWNDSELWLKTERAGKKFDITDFSQIKANRSARVTLLLTN